MLAIGGTPGQAVAGLQNTRFGVSFAKPVSLSGEQQWYQAIQKAAEERGIGLKSIWLTSLEPYHTPTRGVRGGGWQVQDSWRPLIKPQTKNKKAVSCVPASVKVQVVLLLLLCPPPLRASPNWKTQVTSGMILSPRSPSLTLAHPRSPSLALPCPPLPSLPLPHHLPLTLTSPPPPLVRSFSSPSLPLLL
jgi:hypothetical protein